ncbi:hypothetical protein GF366_01070 [Candidatus Peregrinibacteria bacterium]|nr:hypothetical protein [Candidatus Peregrinibacteria bacterium]
MGRFLVFIIGFAVAIVILKYRAQIKGFTGDIAFAERIFGVGGTNSLIVVVAILVFILSLMYSLGTLQAIMQSVLGGFF